MIRDVAPSLADTRLGQLRQTNRKIDVGVRIIGPPPLSAHFWTIAGEHPAAEIESAVKARGTRESRRSAIETPPTLCGHTGRHQDYRDDGRQNYTHFRSAPWHLGTLHLRSPFESAL